MHLIVLSAICLIAWVYLHSGRAGFWRADQRLGETPPPLRWPGVVAIIPARDEAETIKPVIASHMTSDYPGDFRIILVDDQSSDGTADFARAAALDASRSLDVARTEALPEGWSGKVWALYHGVRAAAEIAPDASFILFTDADIVHDPRTLRRLVAKAEAESLSLASLMARLDARGFWGELLVPAFIYFFQKLYPFPASNDPWSDVAAAAGGCMLVRKDALEASGGVEAFRGALIDDCALARQIKGDAARRIWLGLAEDEAVSLRDNRSLSSVWKMVARTAFTQLDHSWAKTIGAAAGMSVLYLAAPLIIVAWPWHQNAVAGWLSLAAIAVMTWTYRPTSRLYEQAGWKALSLPIAAALYTLMTLSSAWRHARGRGGQWKGRSY